MCETCSELKDIKFQSDILIGHNFLKAPSHPHANPSHRLSICPTGTTTFKTPPPPSKDTRSITFWCLFTHCSGVSTVDFEQVNASWEANVY